jgi:hypothetical protein
MCITSFTRIRQWIPFFTRLIQFMSFYPILNFNIIFLTTSWSIKLFLTFRFLVTVFCVLLICCKPWTLEPTLFDSSRCQKFRPIYHVVSSSSQTNATVVPYCRRPTALCRFPFIFSLLTHVLINYVWFVHSFDSSINRYSICTPVLVPHGDEM